MSAPLVSPPKAQRASMARSARTPMLGRPEVGGMISDLGRAYLSRRRKRFVMEDPYEISPYPSTIEDLSKPWCRLALAVIMLSVILGGFLSTLGN